MVKIQSIVITAPHSVCTDGRRTTQHPCDSITHSYASLLHQELQKRKLPSALLLADQERRVCDLNRRACRHTPYRQQLRSLLKPGVFVLDAHSFPESSWAIDGYFLDDSWPPASYTAELVAYLNQRLPRNFLLRHGGSNDIQDEARERGAAAVLLELNEQRYATVSKQQPIILLLADWLESQMVPSSDSSSNNNNKIIPSTDYIQF